jgi:hypothetical protein
METYQEFINRKNEEFKKTAPKPFKDISRKGSHRFKRAAWTFMVQHNLKNKVFIIERLEREEFIGENTHQDLKIGDVEYRIGYYIVGKIGKANSKWVWGQFCPLIPIEDFNKLIEKARQEGTLLQ